MKKITKNTTLIIIATLVLIICGVAGFILGDNHPENTNSNTSEQVSEPSVEISESSTGSIDEIQIEESKEIEETDVSDMSDEVEIKEDTETDNETVSSTPSVEDSYSEDVSKDKEPTSVIDDEVISGVKDKNDSITSTDDTNKWDVSHGGDNPFDNNDGETSVDILNEDDILDNDDLKPGEGPNF